MTSDKPGDNQRGKVVTVDCQSGRYAAEEQAARPLIRQQRGGQQRVSADEVLGLDGLPTKSDAR